VKYRSDGMSYADIAQLLPTKRSVEQIRDRFKHYIDPSLKTKKKDAKKAPWSDQETQTLYHAQKIMGNKWAAISKLLPGRSENDVKNKWYNAKNAARRALRKSGSATESDNAELAVSARSPGSDSLLPHDGGDNEYYYFEYEQEPFVFDSRLSVEDASWPETQNAYV